MTPIDYVAWTDTTGAGASIPYLQGGVSEEGEEIIAVICEMQMWDAKRKASIYGYYNRLIRGDSDDVLRAKLAQEREAVEQIERLRYRLIEEVGDLLWFCARLARLGDAQLWQRRDHLYGVVEACKMLHIPADRLIEIAIDANVAKLTRRQAENTIKGEGDR